MYRKGQPESAYKSYIFVQIAVLDGCVFKELEKRLLYPDGYNYFLRGAFLSLANGTGGK